MGQTVLVGLADLVDKQLDQARICTMVVDRFASSDEESNEKDLDGLWLVEQPTAAYPSFQSMLSRSECEILQRH